jgi:Domain of unknown function (DUF4440)
MIDVKEEDKTQIVAVTRELIQSMIKRDIHTVIAITDKNFTLTHITGYIQSRDDWFEEIEKQSMKYYAAEELAHSIDVDSNKAIFTIQNLLDARIWGSRNIWRLQQSMKLEKRKNKWIILSSVAKTF